MSPRLRTITASPSLYLSYDASNRTPFIPRRLAAKSLRDLQAFLYWGCRTCSSSECAARRRDMCGRPLPCGHLCCGLRGEADVATSAAGSSEPPVRTHPRCVECGSDPSSASLPGGLTGAGPATAAALMRECCFCWEPLRTAPCIEMACGSRHMCHLHCAVSPDTVSSEVFSKSELLKASE